MTAFFIFLLKIYTHRGIIYTYPYGYIKVGGFLDLYENYNRKDRIFIRIWWNKERNYSAYNFRYSTTYKCF
ncbi:hypothetical protein CBU03nite_12030 [Clostridium butyricum]|nr:hypothetical protein CBU01nite_17750 [Clostridium butyricum]GEQ24780.1 hypothetical protein CBU03nite_12030 [Clostridium butyricum]